MSMTKLKVPIARPDMAELQRAVTEYNNNVYELDAMAEYRAELDTTRPDMAVLYVYSVSDAFSIGNRYGMACERKWLKEMEQPIREALLQK